RRAEKFGDAIGAEDDVHILRDAANVTVSPHRPPAADDRFAFQHVEQMIDGFDDAAVSTGKILRLKHAVSASLQLVRQLQLRDKIWKLDRTHVTPASSAAAYFPPPDGPSGRTGIPIRAFRPC